MPINCPPPFNIIKDVVCCDIKPIEREEVYEFTETQCFCNGFYYGDIILLDRDKKIIEVKVTPDALSPFIKTFDYSGNITIIKQRNQHEE